jgi:SNF2 family DNA or RNA helicase
MSVDQTNLIDVAPIIPIFKNLEISSVNKSGEENKSILPARFPATIPVNKQTPTLIQVPNFIPAITPTFVSSIKSQPIIPLTLRVIPANTNGLTLKVIASKTQLIDMGMHRTTNYQKEIIQECITKGNGGLLLPMGTGKTLISCLVALRQSNNITGSKILIIVSKSLITTWKEELVKFFGGIEFEIFHKEYVKNLAGWCPTSDIVIITPEVISKIYTKYNVGSLFSYTERPEEFAPAVRYYRVPDTPYLNYPYGEGYFYSIKWGAVIVDEAHNYFNPTSSRCLAIASLSAHHRWLLSGTLLAEPKPDKLLGYHLMLNNNDFPRNLPGFKRYISSPDYQGISSTLVKREQNIDFTPPTINKIIISHPLSETEALIYTNVKAILNILRTRLNEYKRNGDKVNTKKFSSYIMGMIAHMRQCLVCPLIPITTVAIDVADFEQRSELSEMFMDHINAMGINHWLNDINSLYSSRIRSVCETVNRHPNERIIIFSCYRTVLDIITLYLPKDRPILTISGNDKIDTRTQTIDTFRSSPNGILLLTYEIGANGLNLQCSSTALLVDFWWNAGKSEQAVARLLRPGQNAERVNLYYFTANSGMENALFKLQASKIAMGEEILTGCMTTKTNKIKVDDIIRLIDTEDNISILTDLIS